MPTNSITNTILAPDGQTPLGGVTVTAVLMPSAGFNIVSTSHPEIARKTSTVTSTDGSYAVHITPNPQITPDGTWWEITEEIPVDQGGSAVYSCITPNLAPGADVSVYDCKAPIAPTGVGGAISSSLIAALGDLIVGRAPSTPGILSVGTDRQFLMADSTATLGIQWDEPLGSDVLPVGAVGEVLTYDPSVTGKVKWTTPTFSAISLGVQNVIDYGAAGNGTTDDRTAFFNANAAGQVWVPAGTYRIASNLTITKPVTMLKGAVIKPDSGVTVTFSTGIVDAGPQQVFDTSAGGTFTFTATTNGCTVRPEWWGAVPSTSVDSSAAFNSAFAAASSNATFCGLTVELQANARYINNSPVFILKNGTRVKGNGAQINYTTAWTGTTSDSVWTLGNATTTVHHCVIQDLEISFSGSVQAAALCKATLRVQSGQFCFFRSMNVGGAFACTNALYVGDFNNNALFFIDFYTIKAFSDGVFHDGSLITAGGSPMNVSRFIGGKHEQHGGRAFNISHVGTVEINSCDCSTNIGGAMKFDTVGNLYLTQLYTEANGPGTANNTVSLVQILNCGTFEVDGASSFNGVAPSGTQSDNTHCRYGLDIQNSNGTVDNCSFENNCLIDLIADDASDVTVDEGVAGSGFSSNEYPLVKADYGVNVLDKNVQGRFVTAPRYQNLAGITNYLAQGGHLGGDAWSNVSSTSTNTTPNFPAQDPRYTCDSVWFTGIASSSATLTNFTYGKEQTSAAVAGSTNGQNVSLRFWAYQTSRSSFFKSDARIQVRVYRTAVIGSTNLIYEGLIPLGRTFQFYNVPMNNLTFIEQGSTAVGLTTALSAPSQYRVRFGNASNWDTLNAAIWGVQLAPSSAPYIVNPETTSAVATYTPTYTPSNVTATRTFNAAVVTTTGLADVVGTIIADLQTGGAIGGSLG